ncbi:MAG: hypothetical protein IVW57_06010, partial [Ktedonobacterales bacterium]|nr:hypothetical protein [Ktedonobacterales bacterium]
MATSAEGGGLIGSIPVRMYLPVLVLLGYVAFLITGFGTRLGAIRPVPLYIFLGLLLLTLQMAISENRSLARAVYVLVTSGFALIYAGERAFNTSTQNFTRSPYTYIIINALLLAVFFFDAIDRRRAHPSGLDAAVTAHGTDGGLDAADRQPVSQLSYGAWATDFAGLAIIFYVAALLLDLLGPQNLLQRLGIPRIGSAYVSVDLNAALHLGLNAPINHLENLDLVVALFATAISLLLLVIIGALVIPDQRNEGATAPATSDGYGRSLGVILRVALTQVLLSLRLVLGPLVWLIPAFSLAAFAQQVAAYLGFSARFSGASLLDLFNPLSKTSQAHTQQ